MLRINNTSAFSRIQLDEQGKVPDRIQYLRVGKFKHPRYGDFEITRQVLAEIKSNFDNNIRGIDMALDYFHDSDKEASGWVREFILQEDGDELWIQVDWTPNAAQKLSEREVRYFSPDFAFSWTDPEKGVTYANVAFGGGLTNRPFVKEMKAIVAHETKGENMTDLEKAQARVKELEAQTLKLSEEVKAGEKKLADAGGSKVQELEAKIAALQQELNAAKQSESAQLEEKKKLQSQYDESQKQVLASEAAAKTAKKESEFNVLLSEGKAVAAQKTAFMAGDMTEFIKLAQPVNLNPNGSSASIDPTEKEKVDKTMKLAEEKIKMAKDKGQTLSLGDAISLARKEIK